MKTSDRLGKLNNKQVFLSLMQKHFWLIGICAVMLLRCSGGQPPNLGVVNGNLSACPDSPNCVSSQTTDNKHYIEPLHYQGALSEAMSRLISVIDSMSRTKIVTLKKDYIHVEFASRLFRFVDDVEFYLDQDGKTVHLRSASRTGYYDMGANRKRIEAIRKNFDILKTP